MKTITRVSILLFLIVLLVIISSIQKIQESFTTPQLPAMSSTSDFVKVGQELEEANKIVLSNLNTLRLDSMG